jgi:hypothetical protein
LISVSIALFIGSFLGTLISKFLVRYKVEKAQKAKPPKEEGKILELSIGYPHSYIYRPFLFLMIAFAFMFLWMYSDLKSMSEDVWSRSTSDLAILVSVCFFLLASIAWYSLTLVIGARYRVTAKGIEKHSPWSTSFSVRWEEITNIRHSELLHGPIFYIETTKGRMRMARDMQGVVSFLAVLAQNVPQNRWKGAEKLVLTDKGPLEPLELLLRPEAYLRSKNLTKGDLATVLKYTDAKHHDHVAGIWSEIDGIVSANDDQAIPSKNERKEIRRRLKRRGLVSSMRRRWYSKRYEPSEKRP